jgi:hypothetical protein
MDQLRNLSKDDAKKVAEQLATPNGQALLKLTKVLPDMVDNQDLSTKLRDFVNLVESFQKKNYTISMTIPVLVKVSASSREEAITQALDLYKKDFSEILSQLQETASLDLDRVKKGQMNVERK